MSERPQLLIRSKDKQLVSRLKDAWPEGKAMRRFTKLELPEGSIVLYDLASGMTEDIAELVKQFNVQSVTILFYSGTPPLSDALAQLQKALPRAHVSGLEALEKFLKVAHHLMRMTTDLDAALRYNQDPFSLTFTNTRLMLLDVCEYLNPYGFDDPRHAPTDREALKTNFQQRRNYLSIAPPSPFQAWAQQLSAALHPIMLLADDATQDEQPLIARSATNMIDDLVERLDAYRALRLSPREHNTAILAALAARDKL